MCILVDFIVRLTKRTNILSACELGDEKRGSVAQPSQRRMSFQDEVATIASNIATKSRVKQYQYDGKFSINRFYFSSYYYTSKTISVQFPCSR
jgi:hypothetical protein